MGGHLVHFIHWVTEETENGGPWAIAGVIVGGIVGYIINPIMQPSDLCKETGFGKNAIGQCPDVFQPEALVSVVGTAALVGAVGMFIAWVIGQGQKSQ